MTTDIQKYKYIDALRGYAILGVLLVHASQSLAPVNSTLQQLMSGGARGVQLFYVTSALTLCMSWHFRSAKEASPVRNFFIRRFFRIAPMFYIAIALYVFLEGFAPRYWAPNGLEWWFIPMTMSFLHGFHPETITSVVPGGWSIAVEMNFYLLLPFLLQRLKTLKRLLLFFAISMALFGIVRSLITHYVTPLYTADTQYLIPDFFFLSFFGQLPVFAIGLIAYFLHKDMPQKKNMFLLNPILPGLLILIILATNLKVPTLPNHISISLFFAWLCIAMAKSPATLLINPLVNQFGKLSFSMYLTHFAVLRLFKELGVYSVLEKGNITSLLHYALTVAITALISYLLHESIERPGVSLGKRVIDRLEKSEQLDAYKQSAQ